MADSQLKRKNKIINEIDFTLEDNLFFGLVPESYSISIAEILREMGHQETFSKTDIRNSLEKLASAGYVKKNSNGRGIYFRKTPLGSELYEGLWKVALRNEVTLSRTSSEIVLNSGYTEMVDRGRMTFVPSD